MEISSQKNGDQLVIHLAGRLDAGWCDPVQNALSTAIRDGEHRLLLEMARVDYISSAGLRVLLACFKQLRAIKGTFGVINASSAVKSVLSLAGLASLLTELAAPAVAAAPSGQKTESPRAAYETFALGGGAMTLALTGDPASLSEGRTSPATGPATRFGQDTFALGIGALGASSTDCLPRLGEFLAVAGTAAFQPADGSNRPDFVVSEGDLVPEGHLFLGLSGQGGFSRLVRFEAKKEARSVGLAELAQSALELSGGSVAVIAAVTETAGLVGASLRQSPAPAKTNDRFGFPEIREWLSFTSERAHREATALITGVVAKPGSSYDTLLRPLGNGLCAHFHAAVFPYRPLQKGQLELTPSVTALFDSQNLAAVLHLISDSREFSGAGESEFLRGALWVAPVSTSTPSTP